MCFVYHFGFEDKIWFFLCKFLHIAHLSSFDMHALCNRSFFKSMFHFLVPSTHQCGDGNHNYTGLRPIYVKFFKFLLIGFQMKNNDDMLL